jgi:cyanate permease
VSLTFYFTNADFIIVFIGFLLFRCHKKIINWSCLFCLFQLYFFQVVYMFMSKKNDDRVYKKTLMESVQITGYVIA